MPQKQLLSDFLLEQLGLKIRQRSPEEDDLHCYVVYTTTRVITTEEIIALLQQFYEVLGYVVDVDADGGGSIARGHEPVAVVIISNYSDTSTCDVYLTIDADVLHAS